LQETKLQQIQFHCPTIDRPERLPKRGLTATPSTVWFVSRFV
jgi:hypothetical protein